MCGLSCIGSNDVMLLGKSLLEYTNSFLLMSIQRMTK